MPWETLAVDVAQIPVEPADLGTPPGPASSIHHHRHAGAYSCDTGATTVVSRHAVRPLTMTRISSWRCSGISAARSILDGVQLRTARDVAGRVRHVLHHDPRRVDLVCHLMRIDRPQIGEADRERADVDVHGVLLEGTWIVEPPTGWNDRRASSIIASSSGDRTMVAASRVGRDVDRCAATRGSGRRLDAGAAATPGPAGWGRDRARRRQPATGQSGRCSSTGWSRKGAGSGCADRRDRASPSSPARNPPPSGAQATMPTPCRWAAATNAGSGLVHSDHSHCTALIGWTATARSSCSAVTLDRPMWRTSPSATSSAIAPTISSIGTHGSGKCGE